MSGPAGAEARAGPGFAGAFEPPVARAINHLLQGAAWARERLRPHAGKSACFNLAPFSIALTILPSGEVADAGAGNVRDVCFTLTLAVALRVLAGDAGAWQEARVEGDTSLARDILHLAQNLRWDVEEDLSRVVGDIAAHRMVRAGNHFHRWQRETAHNLARSAAVYWTDEQPLLASKTDVERFVREVDALRDDVARFDKRIEQATGSRTAR